MKVLFVFVSVLCEKMPYANQCAVMSFVIERRRGWFGYKEDAFFLGVLWSNSWWRKEIKLSGPATYCCIFADTYVDIGSTC